ncbi:hypothetical protein [Mycolicibacterium hodleri]|uniref:Methyl-accepting chemotaxis sensory transducer n=1 Tax=Mycolicibacterium hodleri TaxID=49897 RepID=A0A502EAL8_9MYCO|nr:hypothetical protein [Mycolicibacterium hodleri]TPG34703.1 hypothetical protein EAH80_13030 [Mycolicibacterium hodleri]
MPAVGGSAGSYGQLIVTPGMEPPDAAHWDAQEQTYRAGATSWNGIHQQIVTDSARFRDAADSQGFDEVHRVNAVLAEEAKTIAEWHAKVADKCADIAAVLRDTRSGQEQLVRDADAKIASAKLPGEAEALVTEYHGIARYQTEAGVTAAVASHTSFKRSTENRRALDLLTKWGDVPAAPPAQPVDHGTSPGIEQGNDPWNTSRENGSDEKHPADAPADPTTGISTTQPGVGPGIRTTTDDEGIKKARGPATQAAPGVAAPPAASSPLSSMPSVGSMGGGSGGMDSGGGVPKMPGGLGGGGMPGMGSNPLSIGVGEMPGAVTGLPNAGGVPGSGTGTGSPLSAFTQGISTTSGVGGGMPTAPAPASPSPALSGGGSATPVSAAAGSGVAPASAQPGTVAPAAPAATLTGGTGIGGVAPMMLPPGSMGPPAGAVPPPASTVPVGTVGAAINTPSASPPLSGAGATLIPASVVAAGQTAAARDRQESADAAAAKELAWKFQHAAQAVNYPIEWAVGVFRSPIGTETVITSNDGASYIPAGVFIPRSVRVLATDPLVDDHFRQLWFGWSDPARVLVEYAQLRAELGWRLVAAATTVGASVLRDAGVEHPPSCTRQTNPLLQPGRQVAAPGIDSTHMHRLAVLWPDMYPRLLRVMDAHPIFQDRIVSATSASLMNSATIQVHAVDGGIPDSMRQIWSTRGGDSEPTPQQWANYDEDAKTFNTVTSICRPAYANGSTAEPSDTIGELVRYRAHWLVARTAEHIGGWATRPLPLTDMCYAAAAVGNIRLRELIVNALASVEEDLAVGP